MQLKPESQCAVWSLAYLILLKLEWEFVQQHLFWQNQNHPQPAFNSSLPLLAATELEIKLPLFQLTPWLGFITYIPGCKKLSFRFTRPCLSFFYRKVPLTLVMQRKSQQWQLTLSSVQEQVIPLQQSITLASLYQEMAAAG